MTRLRLVAVCLALVLGLAFALRLAGFSGATWQPRPVAAGVVSLAQARRAILVRVARAPEYAAFFAKMNQAFPAQYGETLDMLAAGDVEAAASGQPPASIDLQVFETLRSLRQTYGVLAAKADAAILQHIPDAQSRMMQQLNASNQKLCVDFFYGGAAQDFFAFLPRHRSLAAQLAMAWLNAIIDGKGQSASPADPQDADIQLLDDALAATGMSRSQIDALLDNSTPDPPLPDADMCHGAMTYLATLRALPPAPQLRLLARSLALAARS